MMHVFITFFLFITLQMSAIPKTSHGSRSQTPHQKIIMIDPAGDTKRPGRLLHKTSEHMQTYACAEQLKNILEKQYNVRVILTRTPGEEIAGLQNASLANQLNVDLFLRIQMYKQEADKPDITLYYNLRDPIIDKAKRMQNPLGFVPVHQAHFKNIIQTIAWGNILKDFLCTDEYQSLFHVKGLYGLPLKPLIGIIAPALVVEIGLTENDDQWKIITTPLSQAITRIVFTIKDQR